MPTIKIPNYHLIGKESQVEWTVQRLVDKYNLFTDVEIEANNKLIILKVTGRGSIKKLQRQLVKDFGHVFVLCYETSRSTEWIWRI